MNVRRLFARREGASIAAVARNAFGINVIALGLKFGFQLIYARALGVVGYGRFIYAINWTQLLGPAATLGMVNGVIAYLPAYMEAEDWRAARGILRRSREVTVCFGGAIAVLAALILSANHADVTLILGFLLVPVMGLMTLQGELFRSLERVELGYVMTMVLQPLLAMAGAVLFFVATGHLTAIAAVATFGAAILVIVLAQVPMLMRVSPVAVRSGPATYETRTWLSTSVMLFLSSTFQRIISQSDIVIVGIMLGPADAGLYGAASRLADLVPIVASSVGSIVAPKIAQDYARGNTERLQETVTTGVRLTVLPSLVLTGALILLSGPLLGLFGPAFGAAKWPLIFLALGNMVLATTGPCGWLMALTGHERTLTVVVGAHAALNVLLCVLLIPPLGMNGAAIGSAITMSSWNLIIAVLAKRRLGVRSYPTFAMLRGG